MRSTIPLVICILLFTQCHKKSKSVTPTGSFDTLGIHWTLVESTNIIYCFQDFSTQSGYAAQYVDDHEAAFNNINATFQAQLPVKLRFFIWSDATLAAQLLNRSLGFTDPERCICYVRPTQTYGHEMTHVLSYWAGGIIPTTFTRFVNEGVAVAFDQEKVDRIAVAKSAIAGQNIHSVADLWSGSLQGAPEEVFYPVAGAFMDYLFKQNQTAHFDSLIKHQTMTNAEDIYGSAQLDQLIADFNTKLGL